MPNPRPISYEPAAPRRQYSFIYVIVVSGLIAIAIGLLLPGPSTAPPPGRPAASTSPIRVATTGPADEAALLANPFVKVEVEDRRPNAARPHLVLLGSQAMRIVRLFPGIGMGRQTMIFGVPARAELSMTFTRQDGQTLTLNVLGDLWGDLSAPAMWILPKEAASELDRLLAEHTDE